MKLVFFIPTIAVLVFKVSAEISGRIYNGKEALPGQFKYVAAVLTRNLRPGNPPEQSLCGGALVAHNWILTAAHCLYRKDVAKILMGSVNRDDATVKYTVNRAYFFLHPEYNDETVDNDIALIQIPKTRPCEEIDFAWIVDSDTIFQHGSKAIIMGWGQTSGNGTTTKHMRWTQVKVLSNEYCNQWYGNIIATDLCVKTSKPYGSHCVGDSGGPLVLLGSDEVIGVASTILNTVNNETMKCDDGYPAVFARITEYIPWITEIIGRLPDRVIPKLIPHT